MKTEKKSLRMTISLIVVGLIVALVAGLSYTAHELAYDAVERTFLNQLQNSNRIIDSQLAAFYDQQENNARFLATAPVIVQAAASGSYEGAQRFLEGYFQEQKIFENAFISTPERDTEIVAAGAPQSVGLRWLDKGFNDNIEQTLEGGMHISEPYRSPVTGKVVILVTEPIFYQERLVGILGLPFDVGSFSEQMVKGTKIGKTGYPVVFNRHGLTVAHPNDELILKVNINDYDWGRELMTSPSQTTVYYSWKGRAKILTGVKNERYGFVTMSSLYITDIDEDVNRLTRIMMSIGAAAAVFAALIVISLMGSRLSPLQDAVQAAHKLAKGDIDVQLEVKRADEIGELSQAMIAMIDSVKGRARLAEVIADGDLSKEVPVLSDKDVLGLALKKMVENLSAMIGRVRENSNTLANASEELSTVSSQLVSGSEEMQIQSTNVASATEEVSTNINTMASATEEMSVNVQTVSSTAEQMSQNMSAVAAAIEEMTVAIGDIANNAKDGAQISSQAMDMSQAANATMSTLGEAAKEIGEVTEVIKRIADKTNLLALNATIEAASAGEAGKGFAVVANEIKELANQSAKAAEDIANRIGGVQETTGEAVQVIDDVATIISRVNESSTTITRSVEQQTQTANDISANVQQASVGAKNIASSISEVTSGANDMSKNAGEAARGVNEVSANIQGVSQAVGDSNKNARQVDDSARELAQVAGLLQEMVAKFTLT